MIDLSPPGAGLGTPPTPQLTELGIMPIPPRSKCC